MNYGYRMPQTRTLYDIWARIHERKPYEWSYESHVSYEWSYYTRWPFRYTVASHVYLTYTWLYLLFIKQFVYFQPCVCLRHGKKV